MSQVKKEITRCAIYTRKSTDENLDSDYNSLDAQRESAENYIASQRHEGWRVIPDRYDDGGYTGGNTGYCATKGAVELITKALALEWAPHNIRVNALGPALVITPGTRHIAENPELAKKYAAAVPLGRIGMPEDMVGAVNYLVSDAAGFVTGQTIYVDGGLTAS